MMDGGNAMGWGWLLGLSLIVGLIVLIVLVARMIGGGQGRAEGGAGRSTRGHAREVLDERYARGELTTEEYQERLRVLGERN